MILKFESRNNQGLECVAFFDRCPSSKWRWQTLEVYKLERADLHASPGSTVMVDLACFCEIQIKTRIGKLYPI